MVVMEYLSFDLMSYLQERGIDYTEEGKNTTAGWVEVNCPFCGDDPSYHLGISAERMINCWRCGTKGSVLKYIAAIENVSWKKASAIAGKFIDETLAHINLEDEEVQRRTKVVFPEMEELSEQHYAYLNRRHFDPARIKREYKLKATRRCTGRSKKYSNRIIIPIIMNRFPVNFTAMDYTGTKQRYVHCENDNAVLPMKHLFYNIDTIRDTALIVEGVTDCWRIGEGCIATMGDIYTPNQIALLARRKVLRCFIMFDAEPLATKRAEHLADKLSTYIAHVEVLYLDTGDPGDMSDDEAMDLRNSISL
jgi:hypothetical protein